MEMRVAEMTPVSTVKTWVSSSKAIERIRVLTSEQKSTDTSREGEKPDEQRWCYTRILMCAARSTLLHFTDRIFIFIVRIVRHVHQRLLRSIRHIVEGN